ncbi:type I DNA topoisomerase, partial [bacterium]|nr:type I DNA topoisomerase [bacterium]
TKHAIQSAIQNPGEIDMDLVNAQQARRILDRLVGYKISPLLTRMVTRNSRSLSAGRVQSVALRLVCEREEEIRQFIPTEYWTLHGTFHDEQKHEISAELFSYDGKRINHLSDEKKDEDGDEQKAEKNLHIENEEQAQEILNSLKDQAYRIDKITSRKRSRKAPPPFITSTLQQDASRILGFTGDRTMRAAQALYEGIDIGSETVGLITYMRTDSVRIANEAIAAGRQLIESLYGQEYLPQSPNMYKSKKGAQDAHEAIRPTALDENHAPEKIKKYLKSDQFKVYDMIWKRFLACQMAPAQYRSTTIDIAANQAIFRATGSVLIFDGFTRVYRDPDQDKDQLLPDMNEGDALDMDSLTKEQHFTRPPARYNDASLIRELESEGIGRPSTYASIIKTIVDRHYIERQDRRFYATDLGEVVNKLLIDNFPDIFEVGFTAKIESELDEVEDGKADWVNLLKEFYAPFSKDLTNAPKGIGESLRSLQKPTDKTCPDCGKPLVQKWGRTNWFIACTGYPDCKYTESTSEAEIIETEEECDKCGAKMVIRPGRYGQFMACSAYPKCKNAKPLPTGITCPMPDCDGDVVQRRGRRGAYFYGCSNYPNCNFVSWDPPIEETCPQCGNPFLVKKDYKRKGPTIKCPKKECGYSRPDENAEDSYTDDGSSYNNTSESSNAPSSGTGTTKKKTTAKKKSTTKKSTTKKSTAKKSAAKKTTKKKTVKRPNKKES